MIGQIALAIGLDSVHPAALARESPVELSVTASVAATDSGEAASDGGPRHAEGIGLLRPAVRWKHRGAGIELDLDAAASLVGHTNARDRVRLLPDLRGAARATLVDQWLFVDADARVKQTEIDPYGPSVADDRSGNQRSTATYSVRPHVERVLAPDTLLLADHDTTLSTHAAGAGGRATSHRNRVRIDRVPVPFGAWAEWSRLDAEAGSSERSRVTAQAVRIAGSVALAHEWVFGAVIGRERSRLLGIDNSDVLYGIDLKWRPTPRTSVAVNVEKRFFGVGGSVEASHRTPDLSLGLTLSRQPALAPSALRRPGSAADIRAYLDAILTTRYPDPDARSGAVDTRIRDQGLDPQGSSASTLVAAYPQLQTAVNAHVALLSRRDTVSLTLFMETSRLLSHREDRVSVGVPIVDDNRRVGALLQLSRRLSPQWSAEAIARWSRIRGLAERSGASSSETVYRFTLNRRVTEKTTLTAGLQHNRFETTVAAQPSHRATTLVLGASHLF